MNEWKDCKNIFSNGTEFMLFEERCCKCSRYRNERCRILNAIYRAMWDSSQFPYSDLQDHIKYGGKRCKHYTEESLPRKSRTKTQIKGQLSLFDT